MCKENFLTASTKEGERRNYFIHARSTLVRKPRQSTCDSVMKDFFQNRYYRLNKFMLSCIGQWPLQPRGEKYFFRTTTVILVASLLLPQIIGLTDFTDNPMAMLEYLPIISIEFRGVTKFINCIVKTNTMKELTDIIWESWNVKTGDSEKALLKYYATRGRFVSIMYTVYIYSILHVYLLFPLFPVVLDFFSPLNQSRDKIYLSHPQYYVDGDENYFNIFVHTYITSIIAIGLFVAYDTMFAVHVQHCCGFFAILGARLERIGKVDKDKSKMTNKYVGNRDEDYDYIVDCIKLHKKAEGYAKLVEDSGTECYLLIISISIMGITLTGYMAMKTLDDPVQALLFGIWCFGEILHMLYLCWHGHTVTEHSETIFTTAYNVDWYDLSPPAKRLLILFMLRSLEPCKLTGGGLFVLSMETYTSILKTSMSYFTLLRSMQ